MTISFVDGLGWCATVVFVASYFCTRASALRRTQMAGAGMWVVYGCVMRAYPVIAANVLVLAVAAWTGRTRRLEPSA